MPTASIFRIFFRRPKLKTEEAEEDVEMTNSNTEIQRCLSKAEGENESDAPIQTKVELDESKRPETPFYTQCVWLCIWLANNIAVTMINKAAFAKVNFKYPYSLSVIHMICSIFGAQSFFLLSSTVKSKVLEEKHRHSIVMFSVIFSLNIAIGNTSLRWVSVNFNQVI